MRRPIHTVPGAPIRAPILALALALALTHTGACGGAGASARGSRSNTLDLGRRFPALEWAPANPSYALATTRTADLITAGRELMAAVGLLADGDMAELDRAMVRQLGINPFSLESVASAGVDMARSAIVFSTGMLPTFVIPIGDPDSLREFLDKRVPKSGVEVRRYRDRDWYSYTIEAPIRVQWIQWDGYLAVRLTLEDEVSDTAWLDDIFGDTDRLSHSPAMLSAWIGPRMHRSDVGIVGTIDIAAILDSARAYASVEESENMAPCLRVFEPLRGPITLRARMDLESADGSVLIELTPRATAALRKHVIRPPPGYPAAREQAGLFASFAVDPGWLDELREHMQCKLWDRPWFGPKGKFRSLPLDVTGGFVALLSARIKSRDAQVGAFLGLRSRDLAQVLLGQIPQRRLLERSAQIAGQDVKVIALPFAPQIAYRLDEDSLLLTVGSGVMDTMLRAPPAGPGGSTGESAGESAGEMIDLASLGIRPPMLPDLEQLLRLSSDYLPFSQQFAAASYRRLLRYVSGSVTVSLEDDTLVMRLSMRLHPQ